MTLRFPTVPDLPLANPPLSEVICQVRFPPILKLAEQIPIDFQERVRHRFPGFNEQHGLMLRLEPREGQALPSVGAELRGRTYGFPTADEVSVATVSVNFYALTTHRYTVWEEFAADLTLIHDAVVATFDPVYATRIGLRYVNVLTAESTGKDTIEEIADMLRAELTSLLQTPAWDWPSEMLNTVVIPDGEAKMILRTGLQPPDQVPGIVLDIDYFEEGTLPLEDLIQRCERYHDVIYRAFRWCLNDEAIRAFNPV
jgi:uncharacterized protein (TIGR04255 family)